MKIQIIKDHETNLEAVYTYGHKVLEGAPIPLEEIIKLFMNDHDDLEIVNIDETDGLDNDYSKWNKCFRNGKFISYWPF